MDLRCNKCNKLLARYKQCQDLEIKCTRCGTHNHVLQSADTLGTAMLSNYDYIMPVPESSSIPTRHSQR